MEIARELGWAEGDGSVSAGSGGTDTAEIEDAEEGDESAGRGEGGGGLGNTVSTMVAWEDTEQRDAGSMHSLAMSGDVQGLEAFLRAHPGSSLDQKDDYVCRQISLLLYALTRLSVGLHCITPGLRQRAPENGRIPIGPRRRREHKGELTSHGPSPFSDTVF